MLPHCILRRTFGEGICKPDNDRQIHPVFCVWCPLSHPPRAGSISNPRSMSIFCNSIACGLAFSGCPQSQYAAIFATSRHRRPRKDVGLTTLRTAITNYLQLCPPPRTCKVHTSRSSEVRETDRSCSTHTPSWVRSTRRPRSTSDQRGLARPHRVACCTLDSS